ncbi:hypothetical protein L218DRAFT_966037 [Marasmius fiardii PR-910]|nr:hypothetical protein L218DRAFT_966037 [Marasmius fiardii PR-910]
MSSSLTSSVPPTVAILNQVLLDLHYIHPHLQKLLKSAKPRAGAQKALDGMKEHLERIATLYTAGQQNQDWHSATIFRFYSSIMLLAHVTKISGHSWMLPSVEAERLSKDPKRNVINFKSNDCSQLAIEPELVEKVRKLEQKSQRAPPTAANDLGLSLSEADNNDDLLQDLGFGASPVYQLFPKPPSTKPTVPDESTESEVEVEPSVKKQKGKGKAKADSTTVEAPVLPTLSKKKRSIGKKSNSEFKSKSVVDTDDASDDEFAPKLAHKSIVLKPEARKAEPELPHVACIRCVLTKHDQDCEPSDPNSVPEGIAQSKCVRCNKQNQRCSFSEETDASNDELLKLLAAISSHPKVVKMLGAETSEDGDNNDDDDDADGSLDEEAKAPPPASKTTKALATSVKESKVKGSKVPESKAQEPTAPIASTSGTRTHSGQRGGKPVSTSGANLPHGRKRAIEEESKAGPSSKRTKVAAKDK